VTFRRLDAALRALGGDADRDRARFLDLLFGEREEDATPAAAAAAAAEGWFDASLDSSQREAVTFALAAPRLARIHGPPGTGKTAAFVELCRQAVAAGERLLACAPSNVAVDNLTDIWAQQLPPLDVDDGFLEIQVRDLNACFNLNAVASTPAGRATGRVNLSRFQTLLRNLNLPEPIADTWLDWIDADQEVSGFGAEDSEYLLGEFAHRTGDQLASHSSELRMLRDVDSETYAAIEPYICVLPNDQLRVNINTADPQVIAALNPSLSVDQIESVALVERTYSDVNQVTNEIPELTAATDAFGVVSEFFEIQIRAQVDDSLVELASTLHRNPNDGTITLLTRDFGKSFRSKFLEELTGSEE